MTIKLPKKTKNTPLIFLKVVEENERIEKIFENAVDMVRLKINADICLLNKKNDKVTERYIQKEHAVFDAYFSENENMYIVPTEREHCFFCYKKDNLCKELEL